MSEIELDHKQAAASDFAKLEKHFNNYEYPLVQITTYGRSWTYESLNSFRVNGSEIQVKRGKKWDTIYQNSNYGLAIRFGYKTKITG